MSSQIDALISAGVLKVNALPVTSRYYGIEVASYQARDGRTIVYLQRRFIPQPEEFATVQRHRVTDTDRLDNIATRFLGDPEQYWRICDANRAMRPEDLEAVGRILRITLPQGMPGSPRA